jgi:hypothetical protein
VWISVIVVPVPPTGAFTEVWHGGETVSVMLVCRGPVSASVTEPGLGADWVKDRPTARPVRNWYSLLTGWTQLIDTDGVASGSGVIDTLEA